LRPIELDQRPDELLDQTNEQPVSASRRERAIDCETGSFTRTMIALGAGSRVARMLVERDETDARIFGENCLGPVSVMHIPVKNENAIEPTSLDRVKRGNCNVVEETEAHRTSRLSVVPWRAM
jgi:hypothetical protein